MCTQQKFCLFVCSGLQAVIDRKSVGYQLKDEALVFGGKTLTATDIAVAAGLAPNVVASIGNDTWQSRLAGVSRELVASAVDKMYQAVIEAVDYMKVSVWRNS